MYSTDYGGHYPENISLLTPNYLKTIPDCPAAGEMTYHYTRTSKKLPDRDIAVENYEFYCSGEHHESVSVSANYPKYNGIDGLVER